MAFIYHSVLVLGISTKGWVGAMINFLNVVNRTVQSIYLNTPCVFPFL